MLAGSKSDNVFAREFGLLIDILGDVIDYAVMKWLNDAVPTLVEQEYRHA